MNTKNLEIMWNQLVSQIKTYPEVNASQMSAFFSRLQAQAMSEDFLMITADTEFIKSWVEKNYLPFIHRALKDIYQTDFTLAIEIDPSSHSNIDTTTAPGITPSQQIPATLQQTSPMVNEAINPTSQPTITQDISNKATVYQNDELPDDQHSISDLYSEGSYIDNYKEPRFITVGDNPNSTLTFENYVIGESNRMAYQMAVNVAEFPGKQHLNPLFIYGKSGLGKTHLMRAIQNYISETLPNLKTTYVDSSELLSDYMEASAAHDREKSSYKKFKERYEESDVLLIDDVQFLQGKKQTLDIVFQIFNKFISQGKQVVLSADRAPKNIDIDERYKSRFNSGGTIDIQPPEMETKLGIVEIFIKEWRNNENDIDIDIPMNIKEYIAQNSSSNIRELKSAVTKVLYQVGYCNKLDITLPEVQLLLENHFSGGPSKRLNTTDIQNAIESHYKISHADLVGKKRMRDINHARQVAIYLCRQLLDLPYNDIGKKFNRDHSTVMHAVTSIESKLKNNRDLQEEIEILKKTIRED